MGKLANLICMINLLKTKKKYHIKELAKELEVTPRMIRFYKDELEKAGIYVDTIKGKYGGYVLNEKLTDIHIGLSKYDIEVLKTIHERLKKDENFEFRNEYTSLMQKILYAYEHRKVEVAYIKADMDSKYSEKERKKYNDISRAIKEKLKMRIRFISIDMTIKPRVIQPCDMFLHNEDWYVAAFCELKQEIRHFRLQRIIDYKILNERF